MPKKMPDTFDSFSCPLNGTVMVEASAGTGKTYNIQNLYVRMILEKNITPSEILVVTYTEAATAELRDKVRGLLNDACVFFETGFRPERESTRLSRLAELVEKAGLKTAAAAEKLRSAVLTFDDNRIFTIHGFCQRVLSENAFESGVPFDTEILPDASGILHEILFNFCRREMFSPDNTLLRSVLCRGRTPESLYNELKSILTRPGIRIIPPDGASPDDFPFLVARVRVALDAAVKSFYPGILTKCPAAMNKGYYLTDLKEAEKKISSSIERNESECVLDLLTLFSGESMRRNVSKKGKNNPALLEEYLTKNDFFRVCGDLKKTVLAYRSGLSLSALEYCRAEFEKRKIRDNFQTFDDLLTRVDSASARNPALVHKIQEKYRAAVIDEFQDTDNIQYAIFRRFFSARPDTILFMVGDPKQAIYSFRGGDIATYRKADHDREAEGGKKYSLRNNFRSSPELIESVNRIFGEHAFPFADSGIGFTGALPPEGTPASEVFPESEKPLSMVFDGNVQSMSDLLKKSMVRCAEDIASLLSNPEAGLIGKKEKGVLPSDVAVLVRSNNDAKEMQLLLAGLHIPSVRSEAGSVYHSDAAAELHTVLSSLIRPGDFGRLAMALTTRIFGLSARELSEWKTSFDGGGVSPVPKRQEDFRRLREIWKSRSFVEMFQKLLSDYSVRERILSGETGERYLTDLLHLRDLLHAQSARARLSPESLTEYLKKKILSDDPLSEEESILLETDRSAVKLVTVHKSKGLQFPVVFLPDLYTWNANESHAHLFHDASENAVWDCSDNPKFVQSALLEQLQEQLRLVYVALTRAKYYCRVYWGNVSKNATSPLDWLFRLKKVSPEMLSMEFSDLFKNAPPPDIPTEWIVSGTDAGKKLILPNTRYSVLEVRTDIRMPDPDWKITSYSGLTPHADSDALPVDYDGEERKKPESSSAGVFLPPSGVQTGNAWHEILEKIDFVHPEIAYSNLIPAVLNECGLIPAREPEHVFAVETKKMLTRLFASELIPDCGEKFRLSEIGKEKRLSEMEFHYRFRHGFRMSDMMKLIRKYQGEFFDGTDRQAVFREKVFSGGYLNGIIDLVFEHGGKFHIADWKSNALGGDFSNFSENGLKNAMKEHVYYLQYLIYSLALMKFLRMRSDGVFTKEDYEKKIGNVFYIFLRGVDPAFPGRGIFTRHVPFELISELDGVIG